LFEDTVALSPLVLGQVLVTQLSTAMHEYPGQVTYIASQRTLPAPEQDLVKLVRYMADEVS